MRTKTRAYGEARAAIRLALADGKWHYVGEVVSAVKHLFSLEEASEAFVYNGNVPHLVSLREVMSPEVRIAKGRRLLVIRHLYQCTKCGVTEETGGRGINREVRLLKGGKDAKNGNGRKT